MSTICADLVAKVRKARKQDNPPELFRSKDFQRSFRLAVWSAYLIEV
jgi:hypothetical protein